MGNRGVVAAVDPTLLFTHSLWVPFFSYVRSFIFLSMTKFFYKIFSPLLLYHPLTPPPTFILVGQVDMVDVRSLGV